MNDDKTIYDETEREEEEREEKESAVSETMGTAEKDEDDVTDEDEPEDGDSTERKETEGTAPTAEAGSETSEEAFDDTPMTADEEVELPTVKWENPTEDEDADKDPDIAPVRREVKFVPVVDHRLLTGKLSVYNWLGDLPESNPVSEVVEVQFKNTRKGFFANPNGLSLKKGDIVAVETNLGHDIGVVSLTGELVKEQLRAKHVDTVRIPLRKVYRKAKPYDIDKWKQAIALEYETMIRAREIAAELRLNMKIGDVEYQGDKTKAIFYYIADERVDFRELIKRLADTFHIRIEMKQIGARQEAGRIGGIGPCGLQLCCSTYLTNFVSVSTSAARFQDISLNPQKLAGQCGKLKCCLNYEVNAYMEAQKGFPPTNVPLNTGDGMLYHQKTDIFGQTMSYTPDKEGRGAMVKLPVERVKEIMAMNRKGEIPPKAIELAPEDEPIKYTDGVGEESLSRFDSKRSHRHRSRNRGNNFKDRGNGNNRPRRDTPRNDQNGSPETHE